MFFFYGILSQKFAGTVSCIAIIDSHFLIQYFLFHCLSHTVAAYTQTIPHSRTIRLSMLTVLRVYRIIYTLESTAHTESIELGIDFSHTKPNCCGP